MRRPSLSKIAHSVNDYTLREHAGWTKNSDIVEIHTHTLTGDSAEHVLSCYGTNLKNGKKKRNEQLQQEMIGPHCPYCKMVNIPDSQFCSSCHRAISPVTYNKIMEDNEQPKKEVKEIRGLVYAMQETIQWFQKNGVLDPVTFLVNENNKRKSRERE